MDGDAPSDDFFGKSTSVLQLFEVPAFCRLCDYYFDTHERVIFCIRKPKSSNRSSLSAGGRACVVDLCLIAPIRSFVYPVGPHMHESTLDNLLGGGVPLGEVTEFCELRSFVLHITIDSIL